MHGQTKHGTIYVSGGTLDRLAGAYNHGSETIPATDTVDGDGRPVLQIAGIRVAEEPEPHNIEAEAALLGALMLENKLLDDVAMLQAEHFYEPVHGRIFTALRQTVAKGMVASPITLRPPLENDDALAELGGPMYLAQLTGSGAALLGARDFARQIMDLFELRQLRALLKKAIERVDAGEVDSSAQMIVADLEADAQEVLIEMPVKSTSRFADAFDEVAREFEATAAGKEAAGMLVKGFDDWNRVVGRMEESDFILLGARPSMGKTAVALKVAKAAADAGIGTDFLSLEMDKRKTTRRILADMIYSPGHTSTYQNLLDGKLTRTDWREIAEARTALDQLPLTISDPATMMVEDVVPHIRRRQREFERRGHKLQLIVLDYIGRLGSRKRFQSETELLSYISRMLKAAAKECGIILIALAQLSRGLEQRENKRPMLADLRQSGSLEQDADTVVFLYREEYYLERTEPPHGTEKWDKWRDEVDMVRNHLEIFSSKRREGPLSRRVSRFYTAYQAIRDSDDPNVLDAPELF